MIRIVSFFLSVAVVLPLCLHAQSLPAMPPAGYDKGGKNPGGNQKDVMYQSSVTNSERKMVVYTPPGYNESKKYPVLYGVHGIDAWPSTILDDWCCGGRFVSDNLIAEGKIEPLIIVSMDNNNVDSHRELIDVIIPYVESHYPVIADADHRAIYGYSWGGGVAFNEGLGNLDVFHHIGPTSAAPNKRSDNDLFPNGGAEAKEKLKTLFISCGTADWMGLFPKSEDAHKFCVTNNIPHHWLAVQGGNHDGGTWRPAMWNFLQLAFPAKDETSVNRLNLSLKNPVQRVWTSRNPITGSTVFHLTLQQSSDIAVSVFDVTGRLAGKISSGSLQPGTHALTLNGMDNRNGRLPAGSYVYSVRAGKESRQGELLLTR